LAVAGAREIVLAGVDVASWGRDLPGRPGVATLLRAILAAAPDLRRLRLSSFDPAAVDDDLVALFAQEERLCPHLHLSIQAGDDLILKRMLRRHSRAEVVALAERLRRVRPGIALGADFIVGFPTESGAAFGRTLALVEEAGLSHLHVFPFSPREGTPAARMPQVAREVARERAATLRAAGEAALARRLDRHVGTSLEILMERGGTGRAADFSAVRLDGAEAGTFATARITGREGLALVGAAALSPRSLARALDIGVAAR
ncbi:MAG: radical SAM protein, partial [Hyphomicrobiales bacterium]|nr:radical SAM protein [Hyphomicrobiales bacterium]